MANERLTAIQTDLPPGDWLVVMRLVGYGDLSLSEAEADRLHQETPQRLGFTVLNGRPAIAEGSLYLQFLTRGLKGQHAVHYSSALLWRGMKDLNLPVDVEAMSDYANLVNPQRPIHESFPYMLEDVTSNVRIKLASFDLEPPEIPTGPAALVEPQLAVPNDAELTNELEHLLG